MVKELILDNDRVVLPGLGSFVAEIVPSTFSDRGYTINPPYRRLFFRSKPDEGEMLVRFYAESNGVDPEIAGRIIRDFVGELKSVLHTKKTVVFPGLGRLRATKENNVFFVADEDLDIYPAGFGLEPISLKTHEETAQEVASVVEELKEIITEPVVEKEEPVTEDPVAEEPIDIEIDDDLVPMDWDEIAEEPAETTPEQIIDEVVEKSAEEVTEEAAEQATEEVTEQAAEEVTEQAAEEVTEDTAEKVTEGIVEETVKETIEEAAEETEEVSPEQPAEVKEEHTEAVTKPLEKGTEPWKTAIKTVGITLASIAILLIIYMAVMRLFPDFLNGLLYTQEELEIINFK